MTAKGCECLAEKKYACVSGEKFERTLAHDFEADFFSVVCTRVYNEPVVVEQYWRLMSGHKTKYREFPQAMCLVGKTMTISMPHRQLWRMNVDERINIISKHSFMLTNEVHTKQTLSCFNFQFLLLSLSGRHIRRVGPNREVLSLFSEGRDFVICVTCRFLLDNSFGRNVSYLFVSKFKKSSSF